MKSRQWALTSIAGAGLLTAATGSGFAQEFRYDVGPNYVDQSGTSCRATTEAGEVNLLRTPGEIQVVGDTTRAVICPVNRRTTTFYLQARGTAADHDTAVNVTDMTVTATDAGPGGVQCFAYADRLSTNSKIYGSTRHLCGTDGGCQGSTTYTGTNNVTLPFPSFGDQKTVNFGFRCTVAVGSKILYSSTTITPNP
jgi:hypothetical protein